MFLEVRKKILLSKIASTLNAGLLGDPHREISGICAYTEPREGFIAFTNEAVAERLRQSLLQTNLAAVVVREDVPLERVAEMPSLIKVRNPSAALPDLIEIFYSECKPPATISEKADIHPSAEIGKNVTVSSFCSIGENVVIEDDVILYPQVVLYPGVRIGRGSVIHSGAIIRELCVLEPRTIVQNGAVIGADGFGYTVGPSGIRKVPQVGKVMISEGVEIGANSCVDRATLGSTIIGKNTKLDNLVQVGHNVKIGTNSILCGHVGIAGSAIIGNNVTIGGGAKVADHVRISDNIRCAGMSGATKDLREAGDYAGLPAVKASIWRRHILAVRKIAKPGKEED